MTRPLEWRRNHKLAAMLKRMSPERRKLYLQEDVRRHGQKVTAVTHGISVGELTAMLNWEPQPTPGLVWGPVGAHAVRLRIPKDFDWRAYAAENRRRLNDQAISHAVRDRRFFARRS